MKTSVLAIISVLALSAAACAAPWQNLMKENHNSINQAGKSILPPAPSAAKTDWALNLAPADAKLYLETVKPTLIDVRTPEEYAAGHLEGAILIDFRAPDFREKMSALDRNAAYLIYCRTGKRSASALAVMQELGFTDRHDIAGGITAWTEAGYPTVQ